MQKLDLSTSLKCCCFLFILLSRPVFGYGQLAMNSGKLHSKTSVYTGQQNSDSKVSLKDALDGLKQQFRIQIAYQEGLLEDKFVNASTIGNAKNLSLENNLNLLLSSFKLTYKKINESQISIFTAMDGRETTSGIAAIVLSGKVVDGTDGQPVVGASVYLKNDGSVGTTTDVTGTFKLNVPDKYAGKPLLLEIAYIGYTKELFTVADAGAVIQIKLKPANNTLNEVVVTALGISKQKKSIGYAVTEVKGEEFTQARENNVANALSGKVAGVNAIGLSTGPGGSSRVVIRGNGSLTGDNQPLYVINGFPLDNSVPGAAPTTNGGGSNVDRGDGIAGINPDDIESMTVLKGGTAAALYGSRAANGAILITTKKGKAQKGVGVEFNSTATMENAAVFPDFQYEYGQGDGGVKPTTLAAAQSTGRRSWGSKIDGSTDYVGVDGKNHPYSAQKDNIKNFYQTGSTYTNTLALSGGTDAVVYRFSVADLNAKGILPNNTYDRKTGNLSLNGKLGSKLSFEALAQYNIETGKNRASAGDATANPNWSPYMIANTADVRWLSPGYDARGYETVWNDASVATNGYFVTSKFKENDTKNRFIGQGTLTYEPVKNLFIKGSVSQDHYDYNYTNITPTGTLYALNGQYVGIKSDVTETNGIATINYKKQLKNFNVSVLGGVNKRHFQNNELDLSGNTFIVPFFYSYSNLSVASTVPVTKHLETNSVFASADFDYKSLVFVTVTGRKDWFSTLYSAGNNGNVSIFYPSVNASFILSDAVKLPSVISLFKLRGAYAQVGGGSPEPYLTTLTYRNVPTGDQPLQNVGSTALSNPLLRPYTSTTSEGGFEAQLFNNRFNLDVTYYNRVTDNDIVNATISSTSGYNSVPLNTGKVRNRGIELLVGGTPVKTRDFNWNLSYNFAYNDNKVLFLNDQLTNIPLSSTVGNWGYINNIVGYASNEIVGTRILKDAAGNTVFNKTSGFPVATALQPLGKSVAPYTMGLTNNFRYKRFNLSVLFDGKFGNKVFSISEVYETRLGLLKTTLPGRENGLALNGVDQDGAAYSRTVPVSGLRAYYDNNKNYSELFLHDGSFVKLRQIILSYSLPVNNIKFLKLQSVNLSLVARNIAIIYKQTDNFDPEQSYSNGNFQGLESIGLPRTRSFGLNLSVKF
ncbi:SusC/RagA family protein [Mucilaginibacter sp. PAMC 26640]|nr:SusC/RagA family protein [Mucilaginibacter sp. PAMC 26640]